MALDPYTHESGWIIDTAGRVLSAFTGADCRVAWLVAADDEGTRAFLGPWADRILAFCDPDRVAIRSLGIEKLPAIVHLDHSLQMLGMAEGWRPDAWREVATNLATMMSWTRPAIPGPGDPTPYEGTPV